MLKNIITSNARIKVIKFFLDNEQKPYYLRQIQSLIGLEVYAIRRELLNLNKAGVLTRDNSVFEKTQSRRKKVFYRLKNNDKVEALKILFNAFEF